MSDFQTMRQKLVRLIHQDGDTVPTAVLNDVSIAICDSIAFNRRNLYSFNQRRHVLGLQSGTYRYDLPTDYIGLVGSVYYIPSGTSDVNRYPMQNWTVDQVEEYVLSGSDWDSDPISSRSMVYAVSPIDKQIIIAPKPSSDTDELHFRYQFDPGTPVYKYSGTAWAFYKPDGETTLPVTYTNAWFSDAAKLIEQRALYDMWTGKYAGEGTSNLAQSAMMQWKEEQMRLMGENARIHSLRRVRAYI